MKKITFYLPTMRTHNEIALCVPPLYFHTLPSFTSRRKLLRVSKNVRPFNNQQCIRRARYYVATARNVPENVTFVYIIVSTAAKTTIIPPP